jgi:hypothetical protein
MAWRSQSHQGERAVKQEDKQAVDMVNRPPHYTHGPIEVIEIIEGFGLNYQLGNVVKYILRAPHKGSEIQDFKKARFYLDRHISNLEKSQKAKNTA